MESSKTSLLAYKRPEITGKGGERYPKYGTAPCACTPLPAEPSAAQGRAWPLAEGRRLPHPFPATSHPIGSGSPESHHSSSAVRHPPSPAAAPPFVSSQSVATKTPVKAKPGTGSLAGNAGRLGRFDKLQTARGERGRSAKTRRNGKWIREFKGGAEMGVPPKGKRTALETQWHPGGAGKGAYPYRVRARDPCPGTPGQSPLAMPQQGKPQHIQLAIAG